MSSHGSLLSHQSWSEIQVNKALFPSLVLNEYIQKLDMAVNLTSLNFKLSSPKAKRHIRVS